MADGFIYAIASEAGTVKIGWSSDPLRRFAKVKSDAAIRCVLAGFRAGNLDDEKALHEKFSAYRTHGEWFKNKGTVKDFVSGLSIPPKSLPHKEIVNSLGNFMTLENLTDEQVAALVGRDRTTIGRIRRGKKNPSLTLALKLERISGGVVKAADLLAADGLEASI